jgi:hypothetical protein
VKFKKWLDANVSEADKSSCHFVTVGEAFEKRYHGLDFSPLFVILENFDTASVVIPRKKLKTTDLLVYADVVNNEGDCGAFQWDNDKGRIDYDIDIDYFEKSQQEIYNMFGRPDIGLELGSARYGAARNG